LLPLLPLPPLLVGPAPGAPDDNVAGRDDGRREMDEVVVRTGTDDGAGEDGVAPEPPAASDNWAKPIEGGVER